MARSRNIKPDFFLDDELAEHPALARLFFAGLWGQADYKGCVEWRERKLKAQILPYDDCDVKEFAINLDKSRFIRFYSDGDKLYLFITKFLKHQNPHKNERDKGSEIPEFNERMTQVVDLEQLTINLDLNGSPPVNDGTNPALTLNPYPLTLNPLLGKKPKSKNFKPPTLDQVTGYKSERGEKGKDIDPEQFINHYAAKGWMIGKNKMKDWKAAFRTWESKRNENNYGTSKKLSAVESVQQATGYSLDDR